MGLISEATKVLEPKRLTRWIEVLEADDGLELPAVKFLTGIINEKKLSGLLKPYEKKGVVNMSPDEIKKFRKVALIDSVTDWSGLVKGNLMRLCEVLASNPDAVRETPSDGAPFDTDDLSFLAENMSSKAFGRWFDEATALDEFAKEQFQTKKN